MMDGWIPGADRPSTRIKTIIPQGIGSTPTKTWPNNNAFNALDVGLGEQVLPLAALGGGTDLMADAYQICGRDHESEEQA